MARVKEPSFSEEKEWRLLVVEERPERILFRSGTTGVVRYVEIALPEPRYSLGRCQSKAA
jgi:hypothetical protein